MRKKEIKRERGSKRKSQSMWVIFKMKNIGINRCRGRKCDGIARNGREGVSVCICRWEVVGRTQKKLGKLCIFNLSVLLLTCQAFSPLISLSLPPTLCHILPEIDRAVLDMDSCPVTRRLGQLTRYILDEVIEHLQSSCTN